MSSEQSNSTGGVFVLPSAEGGTGGVPVGNYELTFVGAEGVPANVELGYKPALRFNFKIATGEYAGKHVSRTCSLSAGPKTILRQFVAMIQGRDAGAEFDPGSFVGKPYKAFVAQSPKGKGTRVERVFPG